MIGQIKGKILYLKPTKAVVGVGGIGFIVNATISCLGEKRPGQEVLFWTHTAVRENDISLYGFETEEELNIFELLITVSGVGPKSALAILGVAGVKALEEAISSGDTSILTKISGIGKKTADKIVLELGGKFAARPSTLNQEDADVFDALKSLGYRDRDIQRAIKNLPKEISGTNEKIKYVLKNLGR